MHRTTLLGALVASCAATSSIGSDRDEYNRRSAERFVELFRICDFNRDQIVSRQEATLVIELQARFDDIDTDRDGYITLDELMRYVDTRFR